MFLCLKLRIIIILTNVGRIFYQKYFIGKFYCSQADISIFYIFYSFLLVKMALLLDQKC